MEDVQDVTLRMARPADLAELDALFARSYPALLKADTPPSVLVTALPLISRANPRLLASGTYYVAMIASRIVAAGGYSWAGPQGGPTPLHMAHIRHVVTDCSLVRRGIGRRLMFHVLEQAGRAGARVLRCQSTRMAVPFYQALGFSTLGDVTVQLAPGIVFPAVEMQRLLREAS